MANNNIFDALREIGQEQGFRVGKPIRTTEELEAFFDAFGGPNRKVPFVIGTSGLNTSIDEYYLESDWQKADLPPNMNWEHVTVASYADKNAWLAAKNAWLEAAWTPNQSDGDRRENAQIMRDAEKRMTELEISSE